MVRNFLEILRISKKLFWDSKNSLLSQPFLLEAKLPRIGQGLRKPFRCLLWVQVVQTLRWKHRLGNQLQLPGVKKTEIDRPKAKMWSIYLGRSCRGASIEGKIRSRGAVEGKVSTEDEVRRQPSNSIHRRVIEASRRGRKSQNCHERNRPESWWHHRDRRRFLQNSDECHVAWFAVPALPRMLQRKSHESSALPVLRPKHVLLRQVLQEFERISPASMRHFHQRVGLCQSRLLRFQTFRARFGDFRISWGVGEVREIDRGHKIDNLQLRLFRRGKNERELREAHDQLVADWLAAMENSRGANESLQALPRRLLLRAGTEEIVGETRKIPWVVFRSRVQNRDDSNNDPEWFCVARGKLRRWHRARWFLPDRRSFLRRLACDVAFMLQQHRPVHDERKNLRDGDATDQSWTGIDDDEAVSDFDFRFSQFSNFRLSQFSILPKNQETTHRVDEHQNRQVPVPMRSLSPRLPRRGKVADQRSRNRRHGHDAPDERSRFRERFSSVDDGNARGIHWIVPEMRCRLSKPRVDSVWMSHSPSHADDLQVSFRLAFVATRVLWENVAYVADWKQLKRSILHYEKNPKSKLPMKSFVKSSIIPFFIFVIKNLYSCKKTMCIIF